MIALEKNEKADKMITLLSQMLDYGLYSLGDEVTIEEEMHHVQDYFFIIHLRNNGRYQLEWDIPKKLLPMKLIKFILQPIVENSVEHGFKLLESGIIKIGVEENNGVVVVYIQDNGHGLSDENLKRLRRVMNNSDDNMLHGKKSIGLTNVHQRIRLKYGDNSGVFLSRVPQGGLMVRLILDIQGRNEHDPSDC